MSDARPADATASAADTKPPAKGQFFSAVGRGARQNADGTITVKVDVLDEITNKVIDTITQTAPDLGGVAKLFEANLKARVDATTDQGLIDAVVGKVIASV